MTTVQALAPAAARTGDLPSLTEAVERLTDRGIDRGDVVIQRGVRNYAGVHCPGQGWTCSKKTTVVQHSSIAALNIVECSPDGTTNENSCAIVQVSSGGTNQARCEISDTEIVSLLVCSIDQTNTSGPNIAETVQSVTQDASGLAVNEDAEVQSSVVQVNQTGANTSAIKQTLGQNVTLTGPFVANHAQDGRFCASLHQTSTSGPNDSDIEQTHTATSDVLNVLNADQAQQNAPIAQQPCADGGQTDPASVPNIHAVATQFSETGAITQSIDQSETLDQIVLSALGPVSQIQGSQTAFTGGGLVVEVNGRTQNDTSAYSANLKKEWSQDATSVEAISQAQNERQVLTGLGLGSGSYRDCTWLLDAKMSATQLTLMESDPAQTSSQIATSHCTRSTGGTISSDLNGSTASEQFDDEFVSHAVYRGPGAPPGGPSPFPDLHGAVTNDTRGESFGSAADVPGSTGAFPSEQIRYRWTAHNHGAPETLATGVTVRDVVPQHMTFDPAASDASCSAGGAGLAGDVVTCALPSIPGGGSAAVFVAFDLDAGGYDFDETIQNQASLQIDGAPDVPSNTVAVLVTEAPVLLELHKAVRNDSTGGFFTGITSPSSISALPGHFVRYRLTAHNHSSGVATGVTMSEVVPAHMTAYSCTSPCAITGLGGPGETVFWLLPDMSGDSEETRDVVFRLDPSAGDYATLPTSIPNTGYLARNGEPPVASNSTTVTVQAP